MATTQSPFTREQTLALATDRHLIVSAGAGSGKTSVLVERYVQLLMQGADPRQIVAITFTRKAAAEMLARVARKLDERYERASTPRELKLLRDVRERLTNARISTIHSFCGQLLREFPIEAQVSPNFTELSQGDLEHLRERAVISTMEEWLEDEQTNARAKHLMLTLGRRTVEAYLSQLVRDSEEMERLFRLYEQNNDASILALRGIMFRSLLGDMLDSALPILNDVMQNIEPDSIKRSGNVVRVAKDLYWRVVAQMRTQLQSRDFALFKEGISLLNEILGGLLTQKGDVRSGITDALPYISKQRWWALAHCYRQCSKAQTSFLHEERDEEMLVLARSLNDMAQHAATHIRKEKDEMAALDFDDLQLKALVLLQNSDVCAKLQRKIRYLMVDEFQDTNPLQYQISKRLVLALQSQALQSSESAESIGQASTNIFIVGDAKQSIYGFRNADVRVFEQAKQEIMHANHITLEAGKISAAILNREYGVVQANEQEQYGDVRLTASFRLVPELVAFVNRVCAHIMPPQTIGYEVGYEEMVSARDSKSCSPARIELHLARRYSASSDEYKSKAEENNRNAPGEEELLAIRIEQMVRGKEPLTIWDDKTKQHRPVRCSDIAVLARASSRFELLGMALRRRNIPYMIHSGRGFFKTQEILDMISLLRFLHNPNDDIALAAALRAPFFGLSDTQLFRIAQFHKQEKLWQRFQHWNTQSEEHEFFNGDHRIQRAYRILSSLVPLAPRISVPRLIRTILRETAWYGAIHYSERCKQMEANMEKFLHVARDFENRGFKNLFDFVEELNRLQHAGDSEAEAPVLSGEDAVNIMTIHASKGLEFPVVALFAANSSSGMSEAMITHEEAGITFAQADEEGEKVQSPLRFIAANSVDAADEAEEKRLLYVALTRAKDHLLVTASITLRYLKSGEFSVSAPRAYLAMIATGMEVEELFAVNHRFGFTDVIHRLGEQETQQCSYTVELRVEPFAEEVQQHSGESKEKAQPIFLLNTIESSSEGEIFSASQLLLFQRDPDEYIRLYRLGLPSRDDERLDARTIAADDEGDSVAGTLAGTLIHLMLSRINEWMDEGGTIHEELLEGMIRTTLHNTQVARHEELVQRMSRELRAVATSDFVQEHYAALRQAKFEHSFMLPAGRDLLSGTMDVIVPTAEGEWEVWDWKTNKLTQRSPAQWLQYYQLQLRIYCHLLAYAFPEQQNFRARLFFTRNASGRRSAYLSTLSMSRAEALAYGHEIQDMIQAIKRRCWLL